MAMRARVSGVVVSPAFSHFLKRSALKISGKPEAVIEEILKVIRAGKLGRDIILYADPSSTDDTLSVLVTYAKRDDGFFISAVVEGLGGEPARCSTYTCLKSILYEYLLLYRAAVRIRNEKGAFEVIPV